MAKLTASRNTREGKWSPSMHFRGVYQRSQNRCIFFSITRRDRKQEQRAAMAYPQFEEGPWI